MKKILLGLLFLLLLFFPKDVLAQGTFTCYWNGPALKCQPTFITSCDSGYQSDPSFCSGFNNVIDCGGKTSTCIKSQTSTPTPNTSGSGGTNITCDPTSINTAIGCIPYGDMNQLAGFFLRWGIGVGGGIAFLLIVYAGFIIISSSGNPDKIKAGQELLTSAIGGLILLIFSIFVLRVIGIDILKLPGL